MLKFVPCFYSFFYSLFFSPKPPFQIFSLADIFFIYFFHAKRFACSLSRPVCPFYVDPPWNSKCRLYGENVMTKKDEFENLMLCRLDKCFKRYDIKHYLFIQPIDLTKACFFFVFSLFFFLPKLPFFVLSLANFIFFSHFPFFNEIFFLNGFKDHPTSVDKDKLRKFANSNGLCLSTWVMSMLIGQILHCREAEGWTVSNHAHTNVSKEKVKLLFLIKHLTPEKRDTPLFSFFFKKWIWWFTR